MNILLEMECETVNNCEQEDTNKVKDLSDDLPLLLRANSIFRARLLQIDRSLPLIEKLTIDNTDLAEKDKKIMDLEEENAGLINSKRELLQECEKLNRDLNELKELYDNRREEVKENAQRDEKIKDLEKKNVELFNSNQNLLKECENLNRDLNELKTLYDKQLDEKKSFLTNNANKTDHTDDCLMADLELSSDDESEFPANNKVKSQKMPVEENKNIACEKCIKLEDELSFEKAMNFTRHFHFVSPVPEEKHFSSVSIQTDIVHDQFIKNNTLTKNDQELISNPLGFSTSEICKTIFKNRNKLIFSINSCGYKHINAFNKLDLGAENALPEIIKKIYNFLSEVTDSIQDSFEVITKKFNKTYELKDSPENNNISNAYLGKTENTECSPLDGKINKKSKKRLLDEIQPLIHDEIAPKRTCTLKPQQIDYDLIYNNMNIKKHDKLISPIKSIAALSPKDANKTSKRKLKSLKNNISPPIIKEFASIDNDNVNNELKSVPPKGRRKSVIKILNDSQRMKRNLEIFSKGKKLKKIKTDFIKVNSVPNIENLYNQNVNIQNEKNNSIPITAITENKDMKLSTSSVKTIESPVITKVLNTEKTETNRAKERKSNRHDKLNKSVIDTCKNLTGECDQTSITSIKSSNLNDTQEDRKLENLNINLAEIDSSSNVTKSNVDPLKNCPNYLEDNTKSKTDFHVKFVPEGSTETKNIKSHESDYESKETKDCVTNVTKTETEDSNKIQNNNIKINGVLDENESSKTRAEQSDCFEEIDGKNDNLPKENFVNKIENTVCLSENDTSILSKGNSIHNENVDTEKIKNSNEENMKLNFYTEQSINEDFHTPEKNRQLKMVLEKSEEIQIIQGTSDSEMVNSDTPTLNNSSYKQENISDNNAVQTKTSIINYNNTRLKQNNFQSTCLDYSVMEKHVRSINSVQTPVEKFNNRISVLSELIKEYALPNKNYKKLIKQFPTAIPFTPSFKTQEQQIKMILVEFLESPDVSAGIPKAISELQITDLDIKQVFSQCLLYNMKDDWGTIIKKNPQPAKYLIRLIWHLDQIYEGFKHYYMSATSYKLFRLKKADDKYFMLYSQIFISLCLEAGDVKALSIFLADSLYCFHIKCVNIFEQILTACPDLLQCYNSNIRENILHTTMKYLLLNFKSNGEATYLGPKYMNVRQQILFRYKIPEDCRDLDGLLAKIIKLTIHDPCAEVYLSIILLARRESTAWVINKVINQGFLPLLQKCWDKYADCKDDVMKNELERTIKLCINVIGAVCRTIDNANKDKLMTIIFFLKNILSNFELNPELQETAISALIQLSRLEYEIVADIIMLWSPNFLPTQQLLNRIKRFMTKKTEAFWKKKFQYEYKREIL